MLIFFVNRRRLSTMRSRAAQPPAAEFLKRPQEMEGRKEKGHGPMP